jgi:hypothetical protein
MTDQEIDGPPMPTPLQMAYTKKQKEYIDATLEYNSHRIDALAADNVKAVHYWHINAPALRNNVKAAYDDWVSSGYKDDVEAIGAFIDQVMRRDMALLKRQYLDDLEKARLTGMASGSDFFYSSVVPGNFIEASGWTQFSFSSSDFNSSANSSYAMKRSSTSAAGGYLGIFGGGGSHSSSSANFDSSTKFDASNFGMSFKITQVPIVRPWFKSAFLNSKCWRFDQNNPEAKSQMVSDAGKPPKGLIAAYPTSLIAVKDLVITFGRNSGFSQVHSEWQRSSTSGGGYIAFGPWHLGGSHSQSSATGARSSQYHWDDEKQEMRVDGAQVIGFKCHMPPKSPDPLPGITQWI